MKTSRDTCWRKKYFESYASAKRAAQRRNRKYKDKKTRSYQCNYCGLWHHTTKPKKEETTV